MKTHGGCGCKGPHICNCGTRVASPTLGHLYLESPGTHFYRRTSGPNCTRSSKENFHLSAARDREVFIYDDILLLILLWTPTAITHGPPLIIAQYEVYLIISMLIPLSTSGLDGRGLEWLVCPVEYLRRDISRSTFRHHLWMTSSGLAALMLSLWMFIVDCWVVLYSRFWRCILDSM